MNCPLHLACCIQKRTYFKLRVRHRPGMGVGSLHQQCHLLSEHRVPLSFDQDHFPAALEKLPQDASIPYFFPTSICHVETGR